MKSFLTPRRLTEIVISLVFITLLLALHRFETTARERIARVDRELESLQDEVLLALAEGSIAAQTLEIKSRLSIFLRSPDFNVLTTAYAQGAGGFADVLSTVVANPDPVTGLSGLANALYGLDSFVDFTAREQQSAADTLSALMLSLFLAFMAMFIWADIASERRLARLKTRRELEAGLVTAIERERDLIALDLHDSVLQKLGFVGQQLEDRHGNCPKVQEIRALVSDSIRELRDLYAGLRRDDQTEMDIEARLREIFDEFRGLGPIALDTSAFGLEPSLLSASAWHHVVRIVQELLSNGYKHAQATRVTLRVYALPGSLRILYADDGVGYSGAIPPRLGSVEYRCAILGVKPAFTRGKDDSGFSVKIEVPLP